MTVPGPRWFRAVGPHVAPPRALRYLAHVLLRKPGYDSGEHADEPEFYSGGSSSFWNVAQTGHPGGEEGALHGAQGLRRPRAQTGPRSDTTS